MTNEKAIQVLRVNEEPLKLADSENIDALVAQYRAVPKPKPDIVTWLVSEGYGTVVPIPKVVAKKSTKRGDAEL